MSYILYIICFKVTCLIGNCIALQAVNVAWRTFGTTATTSIHHPRGFQSAAAGAPGFLGHKMPQNGFTTSPNLSASLNHWEWRIHGGTDWQRVTESDREWRCFLPSPRKPMVLQNLPVWKKNWMPLDRRINWCHLLKHGSLWLAIVVLGSPWKSLCNWCAMHLWSVQFLSNQLLKLLRTRTKCAERRLDFVLCGSHVHQFASHKQHTEANHTFCCGDFALDAELFQQLPSLLFTPQDSMAWRFPQNHA